MSRTLFALFVIVQTRDIASFSSISSSPRKTLPARREVISEATIPDGPGKYTASSSYLSTLNRRTKYSDDGFILSTPLRYSVDDWSKHILNFPKSVVLKRIQSHLLFNLVWSSTLVAISCIPTESTEGVRATLDVLHVSATPPIYHGLNLNIPFEMSGGILGILLAFRTGQSYDRFWHGRLLWAKVVNKIRSFARCFQYYDSETAEATIAATSRWLEAFPVCLMQHLRGERDLDALTMLNSEEIRVFDDADSMPLVCTIALTRLINEVKVDESQTASHLLWWQMESMLFELSDTVGEAEAIAGTPVPLTYSRHTSRLLSLWTICMPFVLITCIPPFLVPLVTVLVSWMLLATEEIGHIIEEPFGLHNDRPQVLPLQRYCAVIATDLENMAATAPLLDPHENNTGSDAVSSMPSYFPSSDDITEWREGKHDWARPRDDEPLHPPVDE